MEGERGAGRVSFAEAEAHMTHNAEGAMFQPKYLHCSIRAAVGLFAVVMLLVV